MGYRLISIPAAVWSEAKNEDRHGVVELCETIYSNAPSSSVSDSSNSGNPVTSSNSPVLVPSSMGSSSSSWKSGHISQPSSDQQLPDSSEESQPGGNNIGMIVGIAVAAAAVGLFAAGGTAYGVRKYLIGAHRNKYSKKDVENGSKSSELSDRNSNGNGLSPRESAPFDGGRVNIDVKIDPNDVKFQEDVGLGGGGFGAVFAGTYTRKGKPRPVAIKISPDTTPDGQKLIMKEVSTAMSLVHQNIVKFYGVVIKEEGCYVVMERCDYSLDDILHGKDRQQLTWDQVYNIASGVVLGMKFLHSKGFLHRDLKPKNILFKDRIAKVADFDTAKKLEEMEKLKPESVTPGNKRGTTKGGYTLIYAPPELINCEVDPRNKEKIQKVDVYEFAMVLYEIISGQEPYAGIELYKNPRKPGEPNVIDMINSGQRPIIPEDCPVSLKVLIEQCWKQNPDERPTMDTVTKILEWLRGGDYHASEAEVMARFREFSAPVTYSASNTVCPTALTML